MLLDERRTGDPHLRKDAVPPTMDFAQDIDVFQVRTASGRQVTISIDGTVGAVDPYLRVFDSSGKLRAAAPDRRQRIVQVRLQPVRQAEVIYFAVTAYDGR